VAYFVYYFVSFTADMNVGAICDID